MRVSIFTRERQYQRLTRYQTVMGGHHSEYATGSFQEPHLAAAKRSAKLQGALRVVYVGKTHQGYEFVGIFA